jgi:acyl-CoA dehydrogenase
LKESAVPVEFKRSWSDTEVESFRDNWVRFVETEMAPGDEAARKRGHVGHELWRRAGELGFLCVDVPEEWGGAGGDFRHEAVLHEEMARRALSGMSIGVHSIAAHYLLNHGTDEQKRRFLPRLAKGELVGAIAMTEPGAGSDLQAIRTRAERRGNQGYVLNGQKTFISNGYLAGLIVVVCKTDPAERARGISLMLLETKDCAGFRVGRLLDKIGRKAQDTAELFFDDVEVPAENLLGGVEGRGFFQLMDDLRYERLMIGIGALAAMEGAYAATLDYVRQRQAFGRAIADFQHTRFKLAEVATEIMAGRAFVDRCVDELLTGRLDAATAAMAKLWASEAEGRAIDTLLQMHGGYGYMNEFMIARMYADARIARIYGGSNEIMKEVIARAL